MTQMLTPHTVCLLKLLTYQDHNDSVLAARFRRPVNDDAADFVIAEMNVDCRVI